MEEYFQKYQRAIIGRDHYIKTHLHDSIKLIYADWTASGRMYLPIEESLLRDVYPYVANTHTDTNYTGSKMTFAYRKAQDVIKMHVGASKDDILISSNAGMTGVVNKLQRILGLRIHERFKDTVNLSVDERPIIFVTHMEHHSNQTSWMETLADVVVVPPDERGLVSVDKFQHYFQHFSKRKVKIAAISACSNVTGIFCPYLDIAEVAHRHDGWCFVDFACSAPYIDINMHPDDLRGRYLDAIYFSPHKFLGGPGSTGILVFNRKLYSNAIPDHPGGGTIDWSNPWGEHKYVDDIEAREDGGTPAFLQTIKAAMAIRLKEEMGVDNIHRRDRELLEIVWGELSDVPNLHILAEEHRDRLGIVSFYIEDLHHHVGVKILNDRFGIQTRGGCSCAGTYGHYLLNVSRRQSREITNRINRGDHSTKPGWIRLSFHPTDSDSDMLFITEAIRQLAKNHRRWSNDYFIDLGKGRIKPKNSQLDFELYEEIENSLELRRAS